MSSFWLINSCECGILFPFWSSTCLVWLSTWHFCLSATYATYTQGVLPLTTIVLGGAGSSEGRGRMGKEELVRVLPAPVIQKSPWLLLYHVQPTPILDVTAAAQCPRTQLLLQQTLGGGHHSGTPTKLVPHCPPSSHQHYITDMLATYVDGHVHEPLADMQYHLSTTNVVDQNKRLLGLRLRRRAAF